MKRVCKVICKISLLCSLRSLGTVAQKALYGRNNVVACQGKDCMGCSISRLVKKLKHLAGKNQRCTGMPWLGLCNNNQIIKNFILILLGRFLRQRHALFSNTLYKAAPGNNKYFSLWLKCQSPLNGRLQKRKFSVNRQELLRVFRYGGWPKTLTNAPSQNYNVRKSFYTHKKQNSCVTVILLL